VNARSRGQRAIKRRRKRQSIGPFAIAFLVLHGLKFDRGAGRPEPNPVSTLINGGFAG
jgi:hypothetical protein